MYTFFFWQSQGMLYLKSGWKTLFYLIFLTGVRVFFRVSIAFSKECVSKSMFYLLLTGAGLALVKSDSRADMMQDNVKLASGFIKALFGVLYEVYSSSVRPYLFTYCAPLDFLFFFFCFEFVIFWSIYSCKDVLHIVFCEINFLLNLRRL